MNSTKNERHATSALPKTAQNLGVMSPAESRVVQAIVERPFEESWDDTARRLGMARRTLYDYRQRKRVQNAVFGLTVGGLKTEVPNILNKLIATAKEGNVQAARVVLEFLDRMWSVEAESAEQLDLLRAIVLGAIESVSPEMQRRIAHELQIAGLGSPDFSSDRRERGTGRLVTVGAVPNDSDGQ